MIYNNERERGSGAQKSFRITSPSLQNVPTSNHRAKLFVDAHKERSSKKIKKLTSVRKPFMCVL